MSLKKLFILILTLFSFSVLGYETYESPSMEIFDDVKYGYGRLGIETMSDTDILMIVHPFKGSPADIAGLRPGDKILKIDGIHTKGLSPDEITSKIRGEPGTKVTLTIQRGNEEPVDYEITREIRNKKDDTYAGLPEEKTLENDYDSLSDEYIKSLGNNFVLLIVVGSIISLAMFFGFIWIIIRFIKWIMGNNLRQYSKVISEQRKTMSEYEALISELKKENESIKKEIENIKGLKIENEKLSGIISELKNTILDLEMELKIKKSENEKLIY